MLYVVTGPPAAGKSTWVRERAQHGDVTIDFDDIASTLTPGNDGHSYPQHIKEITMAARKAAIDKALSASRFVDVYIIHSTPSDWQMKRYAQHRAEFVTIDPGQEVVYDRCRRERPEDMLGVAIQWYANQAYIPLA